ncbi:MAG: Gfo/Idh/MocA family oxidoreductase, partial [Candidatus Poseidoniaceae archaeon]|nr:Gfo/Idh/MocA family oxidoreductase [Candidatus Poseidoniaceae archaeon]
MRRRIGVVGCGRWGLKHLQALLNIQAASEIDCIVACDTDANVLDSIHLNGIERHQHPETLVETFQLDAVIIATPDGSH